jgi:hypothetical protein
MNRTWLFWWWVVWSLGLATALTGVALVMWPFP